MTTFRGIWYQRWLRLGRQFQSAKTDEDRLAFVFQLLEEVSAHNSARVASSSRRQLQDAISTLHQRATP